MSTGISISSINHIKELAEQKKYAEALEILDTQNLDKSINPQFLRISGEIFRENKRYYDSRRILLKSHEMSPQGTRIIAELIQLYLELGYFTRAKKYYEQYLFYSTEDDTQRDYVEYIYKKATGADIKELASILIPILEAMPEDKWNFEAVLLYDKLDRKDKALEEARYILEHFKESDYIKQVIEYIDDKLDVDKYFYVYPKEEVPEDKELYKDLIEKEDMILEADHYRMFPPEAKILVEVEDKDAIDTKPIKEKKVKKKKEKKAKKEQPATEEVEAEAVDKEGAESDSSDKKDDDLAEAKADSEKKDVSLTEEEAEKERQKELEESKKKEREAALEKILDKKADKKIDKEAIKESAKQIVKNVGQDTQKAKEQVKKVTGSVLENVQKATDSLSDAVGTAKVANTFDKPDEEFVDGIIESIIETPKKSVGEVVTNEELDALVPDSLEAMKADEVVKLEARKEEQERIELEELEAAVKAEEAKKNKKNKRKKKTEDAEAESEKNSEEESALEDVIVVDSSMHSEAIASVSFAELKEKFLAANAEVEEEEDEPLESLGFISVVQSDVDERMENETPEAAEILHRMIDNKEFYTGEDSRGFESKASYDNHGFEVEDYDFDEYIEMSEMPEVHEVNEKIFRVEEIFTENHVDDFDVIAPETNEVKPERFEATKDAATDIVETVEEEVTEVVTEEPEEVAEAIAEYETVEEVSEVVTEETIENIEEKPQEVTELSFEEPKEERAFTDDSIEESEDVINIVEEDNREMLRFRIVLTESMVRGLLELKESR